MADKRPMEQMIADPLGWLRKDLEERKKACNELWKKHDNLTVDVNTGRRLRRDELSMDEVLDLGEIESAMLLRKCNCLEELEKILEMAKSKA